MRQLGMLLRLPRARGRAVTGSVADLFPRPEPLPMAYCRECIGWAAERERARAAGDLSGVTDANVVMREHQRRDHGVE